MFTIDYFHFLHTSQTISLSCTCSSDQNLIYVTSWKDRQIFFPSFFATSTSAELVTTELDGRNVPGSLPNAPLFIGFTRKTTARALWVSAWFARVWLYCSVSCNYDYLISNLVWLVLSSNSSHCFPEDFLPETLPLGPLLEATKEKHQK